MMNGPANGTDNRLDDLEKILADAKSRWQAERRAGVPITERIGNSIPWWLVIVGLAALLLSIPHTVEIFRRTNSLWGLVAPAFVEFGLLFSAANRYRLKLQKRSPHWIAWVFEGVVILASIFVNGAGSLIMVVANTPLAEMPLEVILKRLGDLPVMSQVALVLVPFAGLMIPAGTWVAGEGLARLFLEERQTKDDDWQHVAAEVEYRALYNALVSRGIPARVAEKRSAAYIQGRHRQLDRAEHSGGKGGMAERSAEDDGTTPEPAPEGTKKPSLGRGEASARLDALFRDDPASIHLPVEKLMELTGAQKSAVYEWRKRRANGHQVE